MITIYMLRVNYSTFFWKNVFRLFYTYFEREKYSKIYRAKWLKDWLHK